MLAPLGIVCKNFGGLRAISNVDLCGAAVTPENLAEIEAALAEFAARQAAGTTTLPDPGSAPKRP